tara:strand:- start:31738 stop:32544 length:807 start_codon:yes stop_codon:yes gene_type:complete
MDPELNQVLDPALTGGTPPAADENFQPPVDPNAAPANVVTPPAFDPAAIANAAAQAAIAAQQATQPPPLDPNDPANMSPEDRAAHFQTFDIDANFSEGFVGALSPNEEGQVDFNKVGDVFGQFRDGVAAQTMRHTELALERQRAEIMQQFAPLQQAHQQQQADRVWNDYTAVNPAHAPYKSIVDAAASQLTQSGFQPSSSEQLYATIAAQVNATLTAINPQFTPQTPTTPPIVPAPTGLSGIAMAQGLPTPKPTNQNTNPDYDSEVFG